jgi:polysaccharide pyruvyl transferase WcaK-like protein
MGAVDRWSRPARVGISGAYGGINLGDEAILHAIVAQLRELPVEITVFTRNPEDTLGRRGVARALETRALTRDEARTEVARLDLLILGGGGILYDGEVEALLREVGLAHEVSVPVFVYAVSAGPLAEATARALVRDMLNRASVITVRDRQGKRLLEEVGVEKEVHVTADPALLLEEPLPEDASL